MRQTTLALVSLICMASAQAGPIRDWLKERQANKAGASSQQDEGMTEDDTPASSETPSDRVKTTKDIAYGPDDKQRFDVYSPTRAQGAQGLPVIFMVHGGAWAIGDKRHGNVITNKIKHYLPAGYVLVSVNYRMLPQTKPLDQAHDVAQALAAAQKQARNWGGDPDRFVLMGHSAGAHLVALLSANPDMATSQGARPWLGSVLLDSAAFDVTQIMQTPKHYGFYDKAFGQDPAYWQAASPAQILKSGAHPMLAVCSSRRADSCAQAQAFVDKAKGLAIQSSVLTQDMSHSEINQELGKDVAYTQSVDKFLNGLPGLTPASKP